jgi:hypothetical protein
MLYIPAQRQVPIAMPRMLRSGSPESALPSDILPMVIAMVHRCVTVTLMLSAHLCPCRTVTCPSPESRFSGTIIALITHRMLDVLTAAWDVCQSASGADLPPRATSHHCSPNSAFSFPQVVDWTPTPPGGAPASTQLGPPVSYQISLEVLMNHPASQSLMNLI